jgi:heme exporter protein B
MLKKGVGSNKPAIIEHTSICGKGTVAIVNEYPLSSTGSAKAASEPVLTPPQITFWGSVWSVVWKDITLEWRTRQLLSIMVMFAISVLVVFNFALETELDAVRNVATGLLWTTILLAATLGLNRTMTIEQENRSFTGVLLAPIDRSALYLGKLISTLLFVLVLEGILILLFSVFFNKPFWRPGVWIILFLGSIGYVAAGVLVASMTIQTRAREVLLPVLLLPLSLPCVLAAATLYVPPTPHD